MPAAITRGKTFGATEEVTNTKLHNLVDLATIANIDQTNIASNFGLAQRSTTTPSDTDVLWVDTSVSPPIVKVHDGSTFNPVGLVASTLVPTDYRRELYIAQASTITLTIDPGYLEINATKITKTAVTTLTLTTAGDWAGGSSQQATDTTGFVIIDSSGNLKLTTTAPTHSDFAVSITVGTRRYATVSSTVYRYLGWFRMNGTGSGELDTFGVANIADGTVVNTVKREYTAYVNLGVLSTPLQDTSKPIFTEGAAIMDLNFRPTNPNNVVRVEVYANVTQSGSPASAQMFIFKDASGSDECIQTTGTAGDDNPITHRLLHEAKAVAIVNAVYNVRVGNGSAKTHHFNGHSGGAKYGGALISYLKITELETQLAA